MWTHGGIRRLEKRVSRLQGTAGPCLRIAGEPALALDRAGIAAFRDTTFLEAGPASECGRSASKDILCMLTWDRSHDYVLQRFWNDVTHVTIRFRDAPPSV